MSSPCRARLGTDDSRPETSGESPQQPRRRRLLAVVIVAAVSTAVALGIDAAQRQPLGDDPAAMILSGCFLAILTGVLRLRDPLPLGLAAMAGFPAWAVIDFVIHGGHSLLPFEFLFYAAYAALGVIVAFAATTLEVFASYLWRKFS